MAIIAGKSQKIIWNLIENALSCVILTKYISERPISALQIRSKFIIAMTSKMVHFGSWLKCTPWYFRNWYGQCQWPGLSATRLLGLGWSILGRAAPGQAVYFWPYQQNTLYVFFSNPCTLGWRRDLQTRAPLCNRDIECILSIYKGRTYIFFTQASHKNRLTWYWYVCESNFQTDLLGIAHQLDIGQTPEILLWISDFKSVASFKLLIENYTRDFSDFL